MYYLERACSEISVDFYQLELVSGWQRLAALAPFMTSNEFRLAVARLPNTSAGQHAVFGFDAEMRHSGATAACKVYIQYSPQGQFLVCRFDAEMRHKWHHHRKVNF